MQRYTKILKLQNLLMVLSHLFRQAAVGGGGGEEGVLGGEGLVVGAAGDDLLAAAARLADVHQGPAGHVVSEVVADQGKTAVDGLEITDTQVGRTDAHHRASALDGLAEGVEPQYVARPQVAGSQRGEEGRGAVDLAQPLLHDGQHAVAHRHAGQQQDGSGHRTAPRGEDHRRAPHQGAETGIGRGGVLEHRLAGQSEKHPQAATMGQLLPRDELRPCAALGLVAVRRPRNHLSVAEVEAYPALFQAAVDEQPHGFLFRHNCFLLF